MVQVGLLDSGCDQH